EVEEKFHCECYSGYGLTETAPVLTTSAMKPGVQWEGERRFEGQAMTGYAILGVEIRVVDANNNDVPRDGYAVGEIIARSDGIMKGYWKHPEATAEVLCDGWFHRRYGDLERRWLHPHRRSQERHHRERRRNRFVARGREDAARTLRGARGRG